MPLNINRFSGFTSFPNPMESLFAVVEKALWGFIISSLDAACKDVLLLELSRGLWYDILLTCEAFFQASDILDLFK